MNHKPTKPGAGEAPARDVEAKDANGAEAAAHPDEAGPDPFAVLEALNADNAALKDKVLRTLAEMENLRRRTEREIADARAYGMTGFARDMLNVADNVRRAIETIPPEERANADGSFKGLLDGVELTERDLLKTLERHGVKRIDPKGEKFDPHLHQAMFEVPDASVPNGTVVQVVQAGFVIGERVLRPALVGVSKGGPKAPREAPAGNGVSAANDDEDDGA